MVKKLSFVEEEDLDSFIVDTKNMADDIMAADNKSTIEEELRRHIVSSIINSMTNLGSLLGNQN